MSLEQTIDNFKQADAARAEDRGEHLVAPSEAGSTGTGRLAWLWRWWRCRSSM
jgi:hypothetical protein